MRGCARCPPSLGGASPAHGVSLSYSGALGEGEEKKKKGVFPKKVPATCPQHEGQKPFSYPFVPRGGMRAARMLVARPGVRDALPSRSLL